MDMDTSLFLAKAFGIYLIIVCLSLIGNKRLYHSASVAITEDPGQILSTSILTLILGILLILFHNLWVPDWRLSITLLAWITFFKGVYRILFPHHIKKWYRIIENNAFYYSMLTIFLALGMYLFLKGFGLFYL